MQNVRHAFIIRDCRKKRIVNCEASADWELKARVLFPSLAFGAGREVPWHARGRFL